MGKQSTAETLRCWGVLESGPALSLGGNVSIFAKEHAVDLAALKEHFCVESDFFAQPLQMDAHRVRCLVVVENKAAFRECVRGFGQDALFAYVNGAWNDQAVAALKSVRRLLAEAVRCEERQPPTYLWFDMDGGGISRARHLLERLPGSQCVLMSVSDYDALYAERGYGLTDGQLINVYNELIPGKLSDEGLKSLAERISEHGRGIEQEAMLTCYAQRRFTELFAKNGMTKREEPREAEPEALSATRPQADGATEKRRRTHIITACAAAGLYAMSVTTIGAVPAISQLKNRD
ncbi:Wadjet anti-phage system protein JetD domain-containing protein [uncultured Senegalimassilia sp.]|uniref:Wadjet anti-phage system protein JetD domain-containing protein n=1 Tax=uncultured Senegalimassilia sp. TaxID=1714350 RepID=UPI0026736253|nr:Wadjet anti-phage system protein JetD domain-containing protein [uncultured Senegalimassilia sp.]